MKTRGNEHSRSQRCNELVSFPSVPFLLHLQCPLSFAPNPNHPGSFSKPLFPSLSWSPPHFTPHTHRSVGSLPLFTPSRNIHWLSFLSWDLYTALTGCSDGPRNTALALPDGAPSCLLPSVWALTTCDIRKTFSVPSDKSLLCWQQCPREDAHTWELLDKYFLTQTELKSIRKQQRTKQEAVSCFSPMHRYVWSC